MDNYTQLLIDSALTCIARDWGVIATSPGAKIPISDKDLMPNGSKSFTKDPDLVTEIWSRYPRAGVAVVAGEVSNLTIVDIDSREVEKSLAEAKLVIPKGGYKVKSPRGWHIYMPYDPDLRQTASTFIKHLDIRSDGGYCLTAPTRMPDNKSYQLVSDDDPVPWPELTEYSKKYTPVLSNLNGTRPTAPDLKDSPDWVSKAMAGITYEKDAHDNLVEVPITEGKRAQICASIAGYFLNKKLSESLCRQMLETYRLNTSPEFSAAETDHTVRSIYGRYVVANIEVADGDPPIINSSVANSRTIQWPTQNLICELTRINQSKAGIDCWLKLSPMVNAPGVRSHLYGPIRTNLLSTSGRDSLTRQLRNLTKDTAMEKNWTLVLDQIALLVTTSMDTAQSSIDIKTYKPDPTQSAFSINPFTAYGVGNLVYGQPGQGKSTFVQALLLSYALNYPLIPGIKIASSGSIMMLDWEDTAEKWFQTGTALLRGVGLEYKDIEHNVRYHHYSGPLQDHVDLLQEECSKFDIKLLCIDSLIASSGMDANDAEAPRIYESIIRSLGEHISTIGVTHLSKSEAIKNSNSKSKPYGSVYWEALSRNNWVLEREEDEDSPNESIISLEQTKSNRTSLSKPLGYKVQYETNSEGQAVKIWYEEADLGQTQTMYTKLSTTDQILSVIKQTPMKPNEIANELNLKAPAVRKALTRARDNGLVVQTPTGDYKAI
tara:strand:+ start:1302 stop:3449 length:2148 start_codon:yes stop_codon:yes gene_type:complete